MVNDFTILGVEQIISAVIATVSGRKCIYNKYQQNGEKYNLSGKCGTFPSVGVWLLLFLEEILAFLNPPGYELFDFTQYDSEVK